MVILLATGQTETMRIMDPDGKGVVSAIARINRADVDWNVVLKKVNAVMDDLTLAMSGKSVAEVKEKCKAINKRLDEWKSELVLDQGKVVLTKKPGELRDPYSDRIARAICAELIPSTGNAEELMWRGRLKEDMTLALLAAAAARAATGDWPRTLDGITSTPVDVFDAAGTPVKYEVRSTGARLYSVGRNGKDESGTGDDVVVGK
jgi:hypothetical protein